MRKIVEKYKGFSQSRWKYIMIGIGLLIFLIAFKNLIVLLALGIIVMGWDYIIHIFRSPIHADGLLFVGLIVTHEFGFGVALVFCLIAGNLPEILTGNFEVMDTLSLIPIIAISRIYLFFTTSNLVVVWILLSLLFTAASSGMAYLLAEPPHKVFIEPVIVLVINIYLFLSFGKPLLWVLS